MTEQTKRKAARWATVLTIVALALAGMAAGQSSTLYIYDRNGNLLRMANTLIDPQNCGGPNIVCSANNVVQPLCRSGVCSTECMRFYANCDNNTSNGCETATTTVNNCGGCGIKCSTNHIRASCGLSNGLCDGTCELGYGDCDGDKRTNGCETSVNTVSRCGCSGSCGANQECSQSPANDAWYCRCKTGYTQCPGGCLDLQSGFLSCGGCGAACSTNNIVARCVNGSCENGTCRYGYANCDNNMRSNGCEADLTSDSSCSACGVRCSSGQHCRVGYGSSSFSCGY